VLDVSWGFLSLSLSRNIFALLHALTPGSAGTCKDLKLVT